MKRILFFFFSFSILVIICALEVKNVDAQATPTLSVNPQTQSIVQGASTSVTINITDAQNLGSFDIAINYNSSILQIPAGGVTVETSFLGSTGRTVNVGSINIDNNSGSVRFGAYSTGSITTEGPYGNGALASITFNAVGNGTSSVTFDTNITEVADPLASNPQTPNVVNGEISVTTSSSPLPSASLSPSATPNPTSSPGATTANVQVVPQNQNVNPGSSATVSINIVDAQRLGTFDVRLTYNPNVLQIPTNGVVVDTDFLASTGRTVGVSPSEIDNTNGVVEFGAFSTGSTDGPSGNGTLATITFDAASDGTSALQLENVNLVMSDLGGPVQSYTVTNGQIVVGTAASPSPGTSSVTLQIRLEGINSQVDKNVNVTSEFWQGASQVLSRTLQFASSYDSQLGMYIFSNVTPIDIADGTYDIYVNASRHLTHRFSNQTLAGSTQVNLIGAALLAGDIVDDNHVNVDDYNRMVQNFGCVVGGPLPPDPSKDCTVIDSDLDLDDDVDIFDYAYLIGNFNFTGD